MRRSAIVLCLLAIRIAAGADHPTLEQVKEKVLQDLRRLPNCTCTEIIERSYRGPERSKYTPGDRLQVEVGYVNGEELYSRPGGRALSQSDLTRLVSGSISTGDFVMMAGNLFTSATAVFEAAGEELRARRAALRYYFRVPAEHSYWIVRAPGAEVEVAYHGSFWVAKDTLELIELAFAADDLPKALGFAQLARTVEYARLRAHSSDLLFPSRALMIAIDLQGIVTKVEVQFRDCREYTADVLLHFGEDVPAEGTAAVRPLEPPVPVREFEPALEVPVDAAAEEPVARQVLTQAGRRAAGYIARLPDFVCLQATRTYLNSSGTDTWKPGQVATRWLQYVGGQEQYAEAAKAPHPPGIPAHGAVLSSTGEFASLLKLIFAPEVQTSFRWKGSAVIDGEPVFAYGFSAGRSRARYYLTWGSYPKQVAGVGFEGVVYIDSKTYDPRRIDMRATELPDGFPMHAASVSVEYGYVTLGDRSYLLPMRALTTCSFGKRSQLKNEIEFTRYHRYSAESKISFEPVGK